MREHICLSIGNISYNEILEQLKGVALAEIRIDLLQLNSTQLISVFKSHQNLIATYRAIIGEFEDMISNLNIAMEYGCAYIDIDINTPEQYRKTLINKARRNGCKVILSYHNFTKTPDSEQLKHIVDNLFSSGADIAKIACMANTEEDCKRVLALYSYHKNLVAFAMGEIGKNTRVAAIHLGAPFTYASIKGNETAPGQLSYSELELQLNMKNI